MNTPANYDFEGVIEEIDPAGQQIAIGHYWYDVKRGLFAQILEHFPVGRQVKAEVKAGDAEIVALVGQDTRKG